MVDMYLSPHAQHEGGQQISEDAALLVQHFGEKIALPHLENYHACCTVNSVTPPKQCMVLLFYQVSTVMEQPFNNYFSFCSCLLLFGFVDNII